MLCTNGVSSPTRWGNTFHVFYLFLLVLQTRQPVFVQLLQGVFRVYHCNWLNPVQKASVEACIKVLSDVGKILWQHPPPTSSMTLGRTLKFKTLNIYALPSPPPQLKAEPSLSQLTWTVRWTTCLSSPIMLCRKASSTGDCRLRTPPDETPAWPPPKTTETSLKGYRLVERCTVFFSFYI